MLAPNALRPEFVGVGPHLAKVEPLTRGFTKISEILAENVGATQSTNSPLFRESMAAHPDDNPLNRANTPLGPPIQAPSTCDGGPNLPVAGGDGQRHRSPIGR